MSAVVLHQQPPDHADHDRGAEAGQGAGGMKWPGQPDGDLAADQQRDDRNEVSGFAQPAHHLVGGHHDGDRHDEDPEARGEKQRHDEDAADGDADGDRGGQVAAGPGRLPGRRVPAPASGVATDSVAERPLDLNSSPSLCLTSSSI